MKAAGLWASHRETAFGLPAAGRSKGYHTPLPPQKLHVNESSPLPAEEPPTIPQTARSLTWAQPGLERIAAAEGLISLHLQRDITAILLPARPVCTAHCSSSTLHKDRRLVKRLH
jgi:hypothetical protein